MQVYEHSDPGSMAERSHPWTHAADPAHRYHPFHESPGLIRTSVEDLRPWEHQPAIETFYRLLEWLNGPDSALESNDCAFSGPATRTSPDADQRMHCSGRLMVLLRDLPANTVAARVHDLTQGFALALSRIDPGFEGGAVGATIVPVRFTTLPGSHDQQRGQQLMLSFWAWGEDEREVWEHLDRTLRNVAEALRGVG